MDGYNEYRTMRVAQVLEDFHTLQHYIAQVQIYPEHPEDSNTEGWGVLRQCAIDGQHILECAADTAVPSTSGGEWEQEKAELKQVLLDACARRLEAQKIFLRQAAAQRWIELRSQILQGHRPSSKHKDQLRACDRRLRSDIASITDEYVYGELLASDNGQGKWTSEDPSLRRILRWLALRR